MKELFSVPLASEKFKENLKQELLQEYRAVMSHDPQKNWLQTIFSSWKGITFSGVSFVMILFLAISVSKVSIIDRGQNTPVAFEDFETELTDVSVLLEEDQELDSAINFEIL